MGWNYSPIPKLQRLRRRSLGMDKYFTPHFTMVLLHTRERAHTHISMLGLKLSHVSKRSPWSMRGMVTQVTPQTRCRHMKKIRKGYWPHCTRKTVFPCIPFYIEKTVEAWSYLYRINFYTCTTPYLYWNNIWLISACEIGRFIDLILFCYWW